MLSHARQCESLLHQQQLTAVVVYQGGYPASRKAGCLKAHPAYHRVLFIGQLQWPGAPWFAPRKNATSTISFVHSGAPHSLGQEPSAH